MDIQIIQITKNSSNEASLNNSDLSIKAISFGSRGWSLYTGFALYVPNKGLTRQLSLCRINGDGTGWAQVILHALTSHACNLKTSFKTKLKIFTFFHTDDN